MTSIQKGRARASYPSLDGETVIITGGSSGIGADMVLAFAAKQVIPSMKRRGTGVIINVGSSSWKNKVAGHAAHATCKSVTTGLTRSLARDFGPGQIRVITVQEFIIDAGWT